MELRAIDTSFNPIAYLDSCSSIQYIRKLYEVGTIEIHVDVKKEGARRLRRGVIVFLDEHRAGIIDSYTTDKSKAGKIVIAKGKQLKDLCRLRLTVPGQLEDTQYYGYDRYPALGEPDAPAESIIKHYVDRHMVHPDDPNRAFPGLVIAPDQQRGPTMRWQSRFEPLSTVFKNIGEQTGMGYDIYLDLEHNQFVFDVVVGNDHTSGSDHPVIFAPDWYDVSSLKYTEDASRYMNTAYCGGADEDEGRLIQIVYENDTPRSGFERREVWLDCGSIENLDDLYYEGSYRLKENAEVRGLSGEVVSAGPFKYLKDWDQGDMVTTVSRDDEVEMDARITEVREVYEQGKKTITPTLGKRNKNALDEIRQRGVVR
ncbi:MAG: siphovirus ReqiPepy6 Gp37-like family protein [Burkholderiales bacterium]